jgi:hypothetical protein
VVDVAGCAVEDEITRQQRLPGRDTRARVVLGLRGPVPLEKSSRLVSTLGCGRWAMRVGIMIG